MGNLFEGISFSMSHSKNPVQHLLSKLLYYTSYHLAETNYINTVAHEKKSILILKNTKVNFNEMINNDQNMPVLEGEHTVTHWDCRELSVMMPGFARPKIEHFVC
jgi:hypothetical protein